jgi:hypothetical protein
MSDSKAAVKSLGQIDFDTKQFTADGAYDASSAYENISAKVPSADIVIPPSSTAMYSGKKHKQRNNNLQKIKTFGRLAWQTVMEYGRRNYSDSYTQRYKKILGTKLHSRKISRQKK